MTAVIFFPAKVTSTCTGPYRVSSVAPSITLVAVDVVAEADGAGVGVADALAVSDGVGAAEAVGLALADGADAVVACVDATVSVPTP
ncbi:hypothetical protein GCM10009617_26270 [Leifsonia poae]|uniref:Uncharacterized protein n=1 Tax=Leifsonia poae TaxID=110933 RepID=A0A9W6HCC4_9MICO|nr:hypothetical protein GCM10017584_27570 [Leifsonia poae]